MPSHPPSAQIAVRRLSKAYAGRTAVDDLSFEVRSGEIFGLLGPNGAGKTTTLECLAGLREADSGEIEVAGLSLRQQPREVKQVLGVVLQETGLQEQITLREALCLFGAFYAQPTTPDELLQRFSLVEKADARFHTLSGGERQRFALALAFVNSPRVVILDEPTAGLDPMARLALHGEILAMRQTGQTVLLATHYLEEAAKLCDRVAILHRGRIAALLERPTLAQLEEIFENLAISPAATEGIS